MYVVLFVVCCLLCVVCAHRIALRCVGAWSLAFARMMVVRMRQICFQLCYSKFVVGGQEAPSARANVMYVEKASKRLHVHTHCARKGGLCP